MPRSIFIFRINIGGMLQTMLSISICLSGYAHLTLVIVLLSKALDLHLILFYHYELHY